MRDFRFNAAIMEEIMRIGAAAAGLGLTLHNDACLPYFLEYCSDEQKARWLPGIASGELITAIAMTEPGAGSDLTSIATTARRDGDAYVVNGAKTFITNGINADLVVTAVKTDPTARHAGMSLIVIERGMAGFTVGATSTSSDSTPRTRPSCRSPTCGCRSRTCSGPGGPRLLAAGGQAATGAAVDRPRRGRRGPRGAGLDARLRQGAQGLREAHRVVPELAVRAGRARTEVDVAQRYVDDCVRALNAGQLTVVDAAKAKWWGTELQGRAVDRCLQLHGGYGYMNEYPIARAFADARITASTAAPPRS